MTRKMTVLTVATLLAASLTTLAPAHAGADGRRNTTLALGAAAVYELLQHKTTNALILGAGTAYAAKRYEDARKSESQQKNDRRYYRNGDPYYNGFRNGDNRPDYNGNGDYERRTYPNSPDGRDRDNHQWDNDSQCSNSQDRDNRWDNSRDNLRGRRNGWDGRSLPPGQYKKHH